MKVRIPPPWVLVLSGLLLNILAILITSVVLDRYAQRHALLTEQRETNRQNISRAWSRIETLERKREVLILHMGQAPQDSLATRELHQQLLTWVDESVPQITSDNIEQIMGRIDEAQAQQRDFIDDTYFRNVSIMEVMQEMDNKSAHYKNIALFLQIFGLALILARDLRRKT